MKRVVVRNLLLGAVLFSCLSSCAWLSRVFRPYPEELVVPYPPQPDRQSTANEPLPPVPDETGGEKVKQPKNGHRVAKAVDGRPGFVLNPYTGNLVDVRGIPSMTLVRDPADPDNTHIFRVP